MGVGDGKETNNRGHRERKSDRNRKGLVNLNFSFYKPV